MSSTTALGALVIFIAIGFWVEFRDRGTKVTPATWLPLLWMFICASRSISQWLNIGPGRKIYSSDAAYLDANMSGSPIDRFVLTLMIVAGAAIVYRRRGAIVTFVQNNKALLAFVLFLGVSVLWSDTTAVSFKRWIRLLGHMVMAGVLVSEPAPIESFRSIFRRCAYVLIPLSVVLIKYMPWLGVLYLRQGDMIWVGAAVMKNGLGHLSLVFVVFLIWELITLRSRSETSKLARAALDSAVLVLGLWLLRGPGGGGSSAALACLIVAMAMLMTSRLTIMKHSFARAGSLLVAGAIMFSILDMSFGVTEMIVTALGRNMTFTDRTPLWSILVELGMREPLFGYGYSGFWTTSRLNSIVLQAGEFNQGHNGYLEIFVEGGLVAIGLMTVLLLSVFRKIQKDGLLEYDHGVIRLTFFVVILLANVTESSFARERDLLTFLFFVIAATDAFTRPTDVKLAQSQIAVASRGHHIVGVTASAHRTRTGPSQTVWRRDPLPGSAVRRR